MKHLFLTLFLFWSSLAFSQGLLIDKPMQDGSRFIGSYYYFFHSSIMDGNPIGFSVNGITVDGNIEQYILGMKIATRTSFTLPKDGILLLKCTDDSVIELKQTLEAHETDDIHFFDNLGNLTYNIYGQYDISFETLAKLEKLGISKIRIETEGNPITVEYKKKTSKKIANAFHRQMNVIKEAIRNPKSIRSDF